MSNCMGKGIKLTQMTLILLCYMCDNPEDISSSLPTQSVRHNTLGETSLSLGDYIELSEKSGWVLVKTI